MEDVLGGGKNLEIDVIKIQPKSKKPKIKSPLEGGVNLDINLMKTQPKNKKLKTENTSY